MNAHVHPPVYFPTASVTSIAERLRGRGLDVTEIPIGKATPRFVLHLRCRRDTQTIRLHGFTLPNHAFVAVMPSTGKKAVDFAFETQRLLLSCGGLSEDEFKQQTRS